MTALLMQKWGKERVQATGLARRNTFIVVAAISLLLLFEILLHPLRIASEAALHLECGRLIAEGKVPYLDFFDVYAPMLLYVDTVPGALSWLAPIHPALFFNLFVFALSLGSCILSALTLFQARFREQSSVPLIVIGLAVANLACLFEFGQRDHLFLIFFMPYLLSRWLTRQGAPPGRRFSIACGVMGGIAACLDPLYLIIFVGMELYFVIESLKIRRLLAIDLGCAVLVMVIYALHFFILQKAAATAYLNWALPMVLFGYKSWNFLLSYVGMTPDRRDLVYFTVLALTLGLGMRRSSSLVPPLAAMSLLGFGIYIIQGEMYTSEAFPMIFPAGLALWLVIAVACIRLLEGSRLESIRNLIQRGGQSKVIGAASALTLIILVVFSLHQAESTASMSLANLGYAGSASKGDLANFSEVIESETAPGDAVLILNDRIRPAYPLLLQLNRRPGSFLLWGLPLKEGRMMVEQEPLDRSRDYAVFNDEMYNKLKKEIISRKPKLIFILADEGLPIMKNLKDSGIIDEINKFYENKKTVNWAENSKNHPDPRGDYSGYWTDFAIYQLKGGNKLP